MSTTHKFENKKEEEMKLNKKNEKRESLEIILIMVNRLNLKVSIQCPSESYFAVLL